MADTLYDDGVEDGRNEVKDEVAEMIQSPDTDDPVDTLNALAAYLGLDDYDYFDRRGQWVAFPVNEGDPN